MGQGLRADLERLKGDTAVAHLIQFLRRQGVEEDVLQTAVAASHVHYEVK